MKNRFFILFIGGLFLSAISLSSCEDEAEPIYEGYGLVNKLENNQFSVTLDDGNLIYPQEYFFDPARLNDSTRVYLHFNILEDRDSCAYVRLTYVDTILTKSILPYKTSILDSVGQDPIKISHAWFAHGLLNFEFMFAGRFNLNANHAHMVNLLQCPSDEDKLVFEFRHNDFNDYKEKVYMGVVSFRIQNIVKDLEKPIKMVIKFNDSATTSRSIELTYK